MSFICEEDGNKLLAVHQAFCVTTEKAEMFSAVCQAHIDIIPPEVRSRERVENGLDIHFLFARASGIEQFGMDETLALRDAQFGDYRFSVREDIGRLILPECSIRYLG